MKKVINGKVYDTDKARLVGADNHGAAGDFDHWCETMYRKRTGEFFLHGTGGARSKYGRMVARNEWAGGEDIVPMTMEEARVWGEKHLNAEAYEEWFGVIEDDDTRTVLSITLPAGMVERLRREASAAGMSLSAYIESRLG